MLKKQKSKLLVGLFIVTVFCIISGFALSSLSNIPFGIFFQTVFYFFCSSLTLVMLLIAYLCFKSNKRLLAWIGLVPTLLAIAVVILSLILAIDYRILYFKSISPNPSKTEWIEDLHYLQKQMAEKHGDLYSLISEEKLTETVIEIEEHIPNMTDPEILMALFKVAALSNDCHTFPFIMIPAFDLHSFPFKTFLFPEGLYVVDAGRDYKDLIGARILKIGSKPVEDIYNKLPLLLSYENISSYKERFTYMVMMAEWLAHHGIIEDIGKANFTLVKYNGEEIDLSIPSIKFYPHFMWSSYFPIDNDAPPVYTNYRKDYYQYKLLEDRKTLYVQFNQCENQPGRETMDQFVARLDQLAQTYELDRCIVDIRNNDGGSRIWDGLLRFLRNHETINRYGSLFVLIGRRTFSSAVIFATQMQLQTNAIFIGEPTGQGPVFYSGPDLIDLPHSRLPFAISRRITIAGLPFDKRRSIEPNIAVEYSISDFMNKRDPVLETALTYKPIQRSEGNLSDLIIKKYIGRYLLNPAEVMDIIGTGGNTLQVHLSDFLPNSDLRFESGLYPISTNEFNTDIAGVKIEFSAFSVGNADRIILNWMGDKHVLRRASLDYTTAFEAISKGAIDKGCETLLEKKELYLAQYPNLESIINRLGYFHLRNQKISNALKIFRLNVDLFPESYNVYDRYGEALMVNDQNDLAIQNYKKSLELNPDVSSSNKCNC